MQQQKSPLEEAFEIFDKYNKTNSENVQEQCVVKLFKMGYIIRPALTIIEHDEAHAEILNEGSREWTLHSRATGRPVERPKPGQQNMKLYTPVLMEVTVALQALSRDKAKSQTHQYSHPSGIIEVSVTPPNEQDESTNYHVSMKLWNTYSLYMTCDSIAAASAFIASIMCMDEEIETDS